MSIDIEKEKQRLSQAENIRWETKEVSPSEMVTVYSKGENEVFDPIIYSALIPNDKVELVLKNSSWDLMCGSGLPGAVIYCEGSKEIVRYCRYGSDDGIEPLVVCRYFHGLRESYVEISEEFRLFHELYHDRKQNKYMKIDRAGDEHVVAIVEPNRVQIRLQEIKQFLAIKEMHLSVMFESREHSEATLEELGLQRCNNDFREELVAYYFAYVDLEGGGRKHAFSRLIGKRLFQPFSKEQSGFWGYELKEEKKLVDYIVAIDGDGKEVLQSARQAEYLTPIHFRKQVLDKYYQQTGKYSVEDGYLRCGGLWGMQMDNQHKDRVVAWIGDLDRDLPYTEQLHWKSNNIPPSGGVSQTFFRRQILAQFTDSDNPEHVFKARYEELASRCKESLGWPLLLPLAKDDTHYFGSLRIPSSDEQKDFDDLVLALAKILIDSLNENELLKLIPPEQSGVAGSINRLEKVLVIQKAQSYEGHVEFLRKLQNLRSCGTAHRKGSNYKKIANEFGIGNETLQAVFAAILAKGIRFLEYLLELVKSDAIKSTADPSGGSL
jgi:hypothetical protein